MFVMQEHDSGFSVSQFSVSTNVPSGKKSLNISYKLYILYITTRSESCKSLRSALLFKLYDGLLKIVIIHS